MTLFRSDVLKTALAAVVLCSVPAEAKIEHAPIEKINLYTQPSNPVCGEPVLLIAEIHTAKPGKVNFTLHRRDGRAQSVSLTTQETDNGYSESWHKEYVYKSATRREYMVVVKDPKYSTEWIPVSVKCRITGKRTGLSSIRHH